MRGIHAPHYGPVQAELNGPGIVAPAFFLPLCTEVPGRGILRSSHSRGGHDLDRAWRQAIRESIVYMGNTSSKEYCVGLRTYVWYVRSEACASLCALARRANPS